MHYNLETGKRIKEPFNRIQWVHKVLKLPEFELKQCFLNEHLLRGNSKPVGIVESEKTAIIASIYLHGLIWLAAGSKEGLNADKCNVLKGRKVILFPDLNVYQLWCKKAKELSYITNFTVSNSLEKMSNEEDKAKGLDLADYLIEITKIKQDKKPIYFSFNEINSAPLSLKLKSLIACL